MRIQSRNFYYLPTSVTIGKHKARSQIMHIQFVSFRKLFIYEATELALMRKDRFSLIFNFNFSTTCRLLFRTTVRWRLSFFNGWLGNSLRFTFRRRLILFRFWNGRQKIRCPSELPSAPVRICFIGCPYLILVHLQIRFHLRHHLEQTLQYLHRQLCNKVFDLFETLPLIYLKDYPLRYLPHFDRRVIYSLQ